MSTSTRGSRTVSPSRGGGDGHGSGSGGSVSLNPLSPAAPSTSAAAADADFSALSLCLMPEAFTGEGDFEDYLKQFTTAARFSGWQTTNTGKRPY